MLEGGLNFEVCSIKCTCWLLEVAYCHGDVVSASFFNAETLLWHGYS